MYTTYVAAYAGGLINDKKNIVQEVSQKKCVCNIVAGKMNNIKCH
jgi:hypothetical protein